MPEFISVGLSYPTGANYGTERRIDYTITAAEPTTALRIDKRVFLELLAQFPQMALAVMRELAQRLERTNAQLVAQSSS